MIKYVSLCAFMLLSFFASTQINVDLVAHIDFVADGKGNGNDMYVQKLFSPWICVMLNIQKHHKDNYVH